MLPLIITLTALLGASIEASSAAAAARDGAAQTAPVREQPDAAPQAFEAWLHTLQSSLRLSPSPLDRAMSTQVAIPREASEYQMHADGALLREAASEAPRERLVQWLWAHSPDAISGCDAHSPCPERASAMAKIEPDNGAAWLPVLDEAWERKDDAAIDATLARMAEASRFNGVHGDALLYWWSVYDKSPAPDDVVRTRLRSTATDTATFRAYIAEANARSMADSTTMQGLRACFPAAGSPAPAARAETCEKIARLMLDRADSFQARAMGAVMLQGHASADDHARARILSWEREQSMTPPAGRLADVSNTRQQSLASFADLARTHNEMEAFELQLKRWGLPVSPPADWQPADGNYIDTLEESKAQRKKSDGSHAHDEEASKEYFNGLESELRRGGTPRQRALSPQLSQMQGKGTQNDASVRAQVLRDAAAASPDDRLVQWLWASADPAMSGCYAQQPCADRTMALARREPTNGFAWMPVIDAAVARKDAAVVDAALAHAAAATRFDDVFPEVLQEWSEIFRLHPAPDSIRRQLGTFPESRYDAAGFADVTALILASAAMGSDTGINAACAKSPDPRVPMPRAGVCTRIARLMLAHGSSVQARRSGVSLLVFLGAAGSEDRAAEGWLEWQEMNSPGVASVSMAKANVSEKLRGYFADVERTRSDYEAIQLWMKREGIPMEPSEGSGH